MISINSLCGIYEIKNKINGKRYIGRSVNIPYRWTTHKRELDNCRHKNLHLQDAWNKYGPDSFEFNVIEECSRKDLNRREMYYISLYSTTESDFGYNWTGGGDGLVESNEELRKKRSDSMKRHYKEHPEIAVIRKNMQQNQLENQNLAKNKGRTH